MSQNKKGVTALYFLLLYFCVVFVLTTNLLQQLTQLQRFKAGIISLKLMSYESEILVSLQKVLLQAYITSSF